MMQLDLFLQTSQPVSRVPSVDTVRALLLEGAASAPTAPVDGAYFDDLRARVRRRTAV